MLLIGKIIATKGLKGEVKIYPYTNSIEDFERLSTVYLNGDSSKKLIIKKQKINKNLVYAFFEGINHVNDAEELKNTELFLDEEGQKEFLSDDSYFYSDTIAFIVIDENMNDLGKVKDVNTGNVQDLFIVEKNSKEWYLPNVKEFIKDIDFENKIIKVNLVEGLYNAN